MVPIRTALVVILAGCWSQFGTAALAANTGELEIRVVDATDKQLIPVRMHLKDQNGKPVKVPKSVAWHDHFIVPGKIVLELRPGNYTFEMERGPEYKLRFGHFTIKRGDSDSQTIEMNRFVDMHKEGWYSGDLRVQRPLDEMSLLMRAEDLYVVPVTTWSNKINLWKDKSPPEPFTVSIEDERYYNILAGEDNRAGASLLFCNLTKPLDLSAATANVPSATDFIAQAKAEGDDAFIDVDRPFSWDLPMLIATGQIDSVGICHPHMQRNNFVKDEQGGRPRDPDRFRDTMGLGKYSLDVYYKLLNCGLRLPPSAGSGSGQVPNPVGYNRVYVHCGEDFSYDEWFAGLKAGRVVVTNGPLIRPRIEGHPPGHVFQVEKGSIRQLDIELNLSTREKIDYLEIVQDGKVVQEVRLDELAKKGGRLPSVTFEKSGWVLIRAVANHPETFRFAMTGPYYVEVGYEKQVSKQAAQYFLDWVYARARQIATIEDPAQRAAALESHKAARDYWQKLVDSANAE